MEKDEFSASSQLNLEGGGGAKLKKGYFVFRGGYKPYRIFWGVRKSLGGRAEPYILQKPCWKHMQKPIQNPTPIATAAGHQKSDQKRASKKTSQNSKTGKTCTGNQ